MNESINTKIDHLDEIICEHNIKINDALELCFAYDCDNSEAIEKKLLEIKNDYFIIDEAICFIKESCGYYTKAKNEREY
jgi:hypothetical protein